MKKHTPGPWSVEQGQTFHCDSTVITAEHEGMTSESPLAHLSNILGADECAADAHLIAASPCLLAALKALVQQVERGDFEHIGADHPESAIHAARAAINKTEQISA